MKGLITLIKLHKRELDELRRTMASLENQRTQLMLAIKNLHDELQKEMALAGQQPEMARFFGGFSQRIKQRQEEILNEVRALDTRMAKLSDDITAAFADLKKFEIALENAKRRAAEAASRREGIMMDEIAANQHRRKEEE